jgi:hypothetical protein
MHFGQIHGVQAEILELVKRIDEDIRGNGHPGLKARVAVVETAVVEDKDRRKWLTRALLGLVLAEGIGILGLVVVAGVNLK